MLLGLSFDLHNFSRKKSTKLSRLDFDSSAFGFELGLERGRFVGGNAFLDWLRCTVDEVLRFLEAKGGDFADRLDYVDLLVACSY